MRQRNGAELFGEHDPKSKQIGIIDFLPEDDRQQLLTAILTQDKLGRHHTIVVLNEENEALKRASDFKEIEPALQNLRTQLLFVVAKGLTIARTIRQRKYQVFASLEEYVQYAQEQLVPATPAPEPTPAPQKPRVTVPIQQERPAEPAIEERPTLPLPSPNPPVSSPSTATPAPKESDKKGNKTGSEPEPIILGNPVIAAGATASTSENSGEEKAPAPLPAPVTPPVQPSDERVKRPRSHKWLRIAVPALLIVLAAIVCLAGTVNGFIPLARVFPGLASATITITPERKLLERDYQITATTAFQDNSDGIIQARYLSYTTASKQSTVQASGKGYMPATRAQGMLTFYNSLPIKRELPAGIIITTNDGVQVITQQSLTLQPVNSALQGSAEVPAQALLPGENGNIENFSVMPCCGSGITVANTARFTGGHDAHAYTYIEQSDIDNAAQSLQAPLMTEGQNTLQQQIKAHEHLVENIACEPTITASNSAGNQANQVSVTVAVTCRGEVFDEGDARYQAEQKLKAEGNQNYPAIYKLVGTPQTTIIAVQKTDARGTLNIRIHSTGRWIYQFSPSARDQLIRPIAGKSKTEAQEWLLRQDGVQEAIIDLSLLSGQTLPTDRQSITLILRTA